jgi:hypothetical protein
MRAVRGFGVREAAIALCALATCACRAAAPTAANAAPTAAQPAAATAAIAGGDSTAAPREDGAASSQATPPPEPGFNAAADRGIEPAQRAASGGSALDADVDPSISVVGEDVAYAGTPVGRAGEAQWPGTLARLRGKLDAARKHWSLKHQSAFPTTLSIQLREEQRVRVLKELLRLATAAEFSKVELRVQSQSTTQLIQLNLRSPEWQDSPRMTKRLHVKVSPKSRYLLTWREGSTVISAPYQELFAAAPAGTDLPTLLAAKINEEWLQNGSHRAAGDPDMDVAVLHLDDTLTLDTLLVVLKAVATPVRQADAQGKVVQVSAFEPYVFLY